jgi:hypothetical protein
VADPQDRLAHVDPLQGEAVEHRASSCKGPRCLIRAKVPGLHAHPGWFRGWR